MPDIRVKSVLVPSPIATTFDWLQSANGMLDETAAIADAVTIALATDGRANPDDEIPTPGSTDLRGWWGDLDADTIWGGWPIGSRLWLFSRSAITDAAAKRGATVSQIQAAISACMQPFVDNMICSQFGLDVERQGIEEIAARIVVYRGPKSAIALQYQDLWTELINGE